MRSLMHAVLKLVALLLVAGLIHPGKARAQHQGDWAIGYSFGLPTQGDFFVKHYIANGVGIEMHGGFPSFPMTLLGPSYGVKLNVHPLQDKRPYLTLGLGWFLTTVDSRYLSGGIVEADYAYAWRERWTGVSSGVGYLGYPDSADRSLSFFALGGATYIFRQKRFPFRNVEGPLPPDSLLSKWEKGWLPVLELGGQRFFEGD